MQLSIRAHISHPELVSHIAREGAVF